MSLRTPLSKALGLGSAKGGTDHWWAQRLTAVGLVMLGLWFAVSLASLPDFGYAAVNAWLSAPMTTILAALLVATLSYHSHLGVQVVIEDYMRGSLKVAALMIATFLHVLVAAAGLISLFSVAFGAA